ncbi:hypothetical protein L6164_020909 [Bauhinia variegata]|uniref:Uncharacterized protein n=1 Tax=Bauhinia variegata TaxID=167791 RepID=A0ACB9MWU4_BAUVA|nr:hypothetical protein L6164_020909 [Bauhinia variegata]
MSIGKIIEALLRSRTCGRSFSSFSPSSLPLRTKGVLVLAPSPSPSSQNICLSPSQIFPLKPPFVSALRFLNTDSSKSIVGRYESSLQRETSEEGETDGWEEEEETEPEIGDGGAGGGVLLQGLPWGQLALSIAEEVLTQFSDDMKLYAFKTTPRGYVYVRLDKLTNEYGCPSMEELESYSVEYKKRLDEVGALGEIPEDLALEVSTPGAERILKVPDDLNRFNDMPMRVCYREDMESSSPEKDGVFLLESIEEELESCVWKLANVKENRDPQSKGRPLSRKQKDWRLKLPFNMHRRVTLYLEF